MQADEFKIEVLPVKNKLYRFASRILNNPEEAKDIVQEVFLRLWVKRGKLKEYRSIEAFAMIITKNLCLDKLKAGRNKNTSLQDNVTDGNNMTPYSQTERSDTVNKVLDIINGLPEQQKLVIHLRDVEGCDFDEIAEVMNMSLNNVRVNLSRARKKVRDIYIKEQNYEFSNN
jgi:RNA polymerase sigma-70 factor (ECF subfamily)